MGKCLRHKKIHGVNKCVKFGTRRRRLTGKKLAKYRARRTRLTGTRSKSSSFGGRYVRKR